MTDFTMNPGSNEAREAGCTCPVLDNNYGKFAPWGEGNWWVTTDCPLHGYTPNDLSIPGIEDKEVDALIAAISDDQENADG